MVWVQSNDLEHHFSREDAGEYLLLKKKTDILTIYILYNYFAKNTLSVLYILQSTHHIPHNQHFAEIARHWMMFHGHKQCVQYNADGDG